MSDPLSGIATDTASPHYGHTVIEVNEATWFCATCNPDRALDYMEWVTGRLEARTATLLQAVTETQAIVAQLRRLYE
jgi:hypothetical protein